MTVRAIDRAVGQEYTVEGVHCGVTARGTVVPLPPALALVHDTVPPRPVQVAEYVADDDGDTDTEPERAPPVLKLVPAHEVVLLEAHVSVADWLCTMLVGETVSVHDGVGGGVTITV